MSQEITKAQVQQFSDNLIMLAQQKGSRLRDRVMSKVVTGNAAYFERIGPTDVVLRTSRHAPSPMVDTPHSRRMVTVSSYEWGDAIDKQDEVRMLIDPKGSYSQNAAFAFGRKIDDLIIAAVNGDSTSVSSSLPSANNLTTVSFPTTTNRVAKDYVFTGSTADSNLTIPKLIEARRILMKNDIDENEEVTCVVNASALQALLNTTQATSADYNTVKTLVKGEIDSFLGMKFVRTERITNSGGATSAPAQVLVFTKSAVGLAIGRDVNVRVAERPDMGFMTYVYGSMDMGAVRIEEEKVVDILCVQS